MDKPELTVIAGPNGAGKSTLSSMLVLAGTDIFDGDKELLLLQRKYPDIDSDTLFDHVQDVVFQARKQAAIDTKADFAFETNFGYPLVMNTVNQFKQAGYHVHLYYIGLPSLAYSLKRVSLRNKRGGHDVPVDLVSFNFENGLINVAMYIRQFDTASLLHNSVKENDDLRMVSIAEYKKGKVISQSINMPAWAKLILMGELKETTKKNEPRREIIKPKGKRR